MSGLNLVRGVERIDVPHVTTEYRAGVSAGVVSRMRGEAEASAPSYEPVESHDETAMPDEGGRVLRYRLQDLEDGVYAAESVGSGGRRQLTYFEVSAARVARIFSGERAAARELRRRPD